MNKRMGYTLLLTSSLLFSGMANNKRMSNKNTVTSPSADYVRAPKQDVFVSSKTAKVVSKPKLSNSASILSSAWSEIIEKTGHQSNLSPEFFSKILNFSKSIKTNPVDFTFILFQESKFNPKIKGGSYAGLIQMDETAFKNCALRMLQYEKYCKNNPKEKITLKEFNKKLENKKIRIPDIGKKNILFSTYAGLSRERQFEYSTAYLRYRIHEQGLVGKKIPSNQLWALIHKPSACKKTDELRNRATLLSAVKVGGTVNVNGRTVNITGVKQISPENYKKILSCVK